MKSAKRYICRREEGWQYEVVIAKDKFICKYELSLEFDCSKHVIYRAKYIFLYITNENNCFDFSPDIFLIRLWFSLQIDSVFVPDAFI